MPEIIYGHHPIYEALRASQSVEKILLAKSAATPKINKIILLAKKKNIPIEQVSKRVLEQIAGGGKTQGLVALVSAANYATMDAILNRSNQQQEAPFVALLDGIEDPHNLGAILRSADGAGVHGVILQKRRSVGITSTVSKTSAGATAHVLTAQVSNLNYTIDELKNRNIWIVGADQEAERSFTESDLTGALGVVIGGEGHGLHRLVKEKCDFLVKIPMYGRVNSLNASVAAALLFFEVRRQRQLLQCGA